MTTSPSSLQPYDSIDIFANWDRDNSGRIEQEEMYCSRGEPGLFYPVAGANGRSTKFVPLNLMDKDNDGQVSLDEYFLFVSNPVFDKPSIQENLLDNTRRDRRRNGSYCQCMSRSNTDHYPQSQVGERPQPQINGDVTIINIIVDNSIENNIEIGDDIFSIVDMEDNRNILFNQNPVPAP